MDKLLDFFLKNIPSFIVPAIIAAIALYFAIFYFKGYRDYTDGLHDRWFLSGIVVIFGMRFRQEVCKQIQAAFLVGSILVRTATPSLNRFPS